MRSLIYILILALGVSAHVSVSAQQQLSLDQLLDPMVYSFKCSNTYSFLRSNCSHAMSGTSTRPASGKINPFTEFDTIISTLKSDPSNPFPLVYSFAECTATCNAAAALDKLDNPVILYNREFIDQINGPDEKVRWAVRFIFAHEIGHHIFGHPLSVPNTNTESKKRELEADFFAGFVISQYEGTVLDDALQGIASIESATSPTNKQQEDHSGYPTLLNRKAAVKEGFEAGQNETARLAQFQNIEDLAERLFNANGSSVIFRTLDKMISLGDLDGAKFKIDQLLIDKDFQQKQLLYMFKSKLLEASNQYNDAVKVQKQAVEMDPKNQEQLMRLKELLLKGNEKQKIEAKKLDKNLLKLKPVKLSK